MPAAVVCTSGTAAANLLPASLEAHHAGVPLLLLTADRPPELRGVGANQTTRQPGMFSPSTRFEADLPVPEATDAEGGAEQSLMLREVAEQAVSAALGAGTRSPGPVHLNLPFREPLAGELPGWLTTPVAELTVEPDENPDAAPVEPEAVPDPSGALYQGGGGIGEADLPIEPEDEPFLLPRGPRTVVIAGADAGPDAGDSGVRGRLAAHRGDRQRRALRALSSCTAIASSSPPPTSAAASRGPSCSATRPSAERWPRCWAIPRSRSSPCADRGSPSI